MKYNFTFFFLFDLSDVEGLFAVRRNDANHLLRRKQR